MGLWNANCIKPGRAFSHQGLGCRVLGLGFRAFKMWGFRAMVPIILEGTLQFCRLRWGACP